MSWVDYARDDRWSMADLRSRARNVLASEFEDAADLTIKAAQLATGSGYMTADERTRWDAYVTRRSELETQVGTEWISMQRLAAAMVVEDAQRALAALPNAPPPPALDPDALRRLALQQAVNGAAPDVAILVATRAAMRAPTVQPPEVLP